MPNPMFDHLLEQVVKHRIGFGEEIKQAVLIEVNFTNVRTSGQT